MVYKSFNLQQQTLTVQLYENYLFSVFHLFTFPYPSLIDRVYLGGSVLVEKQDS